MRRIIGIIVGVFLSTAVSAQVMTPAVNSPLPVGSNSAQGILQADGTGLCVTTGVVGLCNPYPVGANPSGSVGTSAVNGSAASFMRSDAAPPLSSTVQSALTGTNNLPAFGTGAFGFSSRALASGDLPTNGVTNAKAAQMPANTVKCNPTGSTANAQDCTSPVISGTITGTASTAGSAAAFVTSSTSAAYGWNVTGQPLDQKNWDVSAFGTTLNFRAVNDANNATNNWMTVTRGTGATVSGVSIPNLNGVTTPQAFDSACGTAGHDCTTGLNSCLSSGIKCYIPCGTYDVSAGASLSGAVTGLTIEGAGYCSFIRSTSATGNNLTLGDGTNTIQDFLISNLRFGGSVTKTGGIALTIQNATHGKVQNIWMDVNIFTGVQANRTSLLSFVNFFLNSCGSQGMVFFSNTGAFGVQNSIDKDSIIAGCSTSAGVHVAGGEGGFLIDALLFQNSTGMLIDTTGSGTTNTQIFLGNFFDSDTNTADGVTIAASSLTTFLCSGCWSASNGGSGFTINNQGAGTADIQFSGARVLSNTGQGISSTDKGQMTITGSIFRGNTGSGLFYDPGAGSGEATITGNHINNNGHAVFFNSLPAFATLTGNIWSNNGANNGGITTSAAIVCTNNVGGNNNGSGC